VRRYFFHTQDGRAFHDTEGTSLPSDEAARIEAARVMGQLLNEHPAGIWRDEEFRMTVTDEQGATLYVLDVAALRSPAAGGST
jgi:hypothetical protein